MDQRDRKFYCWNKITTFTGHVARLVQHFACRIRQQATPLTFCCKVWCVSCRNTQNGVKDVLYGKHTHQQQRCCSVAKDAKIQHNTRWGERYCAVGYSARILVAEYRYSRRAHNQSWPAVHKPCLPRSGQRYLQYHIHCQPQYGQKE